MAVMAELPITILERDHDFASVVDVEMPAPKRHRETREGLAERDQQSKQSIQSDAQLAAALARIEAEDDGNDVLLVRDTILVEGGSSSSGGRHLTNDCEFLGDAVAGAPSSGEDHECEVMLISMMMPSTSSSSSSAVDAQLAAAIATLDADERGVVSKKFNCSCCMEDVEAMKGVFMSPAHISGCRHMMCSECFERFIKGQIEKKELCRCPLCPGPKACVVPGWLIHQMLGKEAADSAATIEQMHLNQVDGGTLSLWQCPMPDCMNRFFVPNGFDAANVPDGERVVSCDGCHKKVCVRCNVEEHAGFSCTQFEEWRKANAAADQSYADMVKAGLVKPCPNCAAPILKFEGCNFVTCTSCKSPDGMCWETGKARHGANGCGGGHGCH